MSDVDYSKTIIYKVIDNECPELVYVGSTTNFTKRQKEHKSAAMNPKNVGYNRKLYISIRENGGWEKWEMIKLCDYPCKDKREAEQEEDRNMMEIKANLNMRRSFITSDIKKEYMKLWREEIKDKLKEQTKQYRLENKEKILINAQIYREENEEKIRQYRYDNKEKQKEYYKK
jgi:hypothetical protein